MTENVTKTYKRSTANTVENINYKSKLLAKMLALMMTTKKVFPANCKSV